MEGIVAWAIKQRYNCSLMVIGCEVHGQVFKELMILKYCNILETVGFKINKMKNLCVLFYHSKASSLLKSRRVLVIQAMVMLD